MRGRAAANKPIVIKPAYRMGELALLLGVTRHALEKIVLANGLKVYPAGRLVIVPLGEIRDKLPHIWDAISLTNEIRK